MSETDHEKRHCTDSCRYAKRKECDCICRGVNHGSRRAWVKGKRKRSVKEKQRELFG